MGTLSTGLQALRTTVLVVAAGWMSVATPPAVGGRQAPPSPGPQRSAAVGGGVPDTAVMETGSAVPDPAPAIVEDFSRYASTSELLSDPGGLYRPGEDINEEHIELDPDVGVAPLGLGQSMRYDFEGVKTISRGIDLPGSGAYEVWIEVWVRFSENFRTDWGRLDAPAPSYKLLFAVTDPRRFGLGTGLFGHTWTLDTPPAPGVDQFRGSPRIWDGRWHRLRLHFKHETSPEANDGVVRFWIDGTLHSDNRGLDTDREAGEMLFVALGRNMNHMPAETVHVWWGKVAIWTTAPGW